MTEMRGYAREIVDRFAKLGLEDATDALLEQYMSANVTCGKIIMKYPMLFDPLPENLREFMRLCRELSKIPGIDPLCRGLLIGFLNKYDNTPIHEMIAAAEMTPGVHFGLMRRNTSPAFQNVEPGRV